MSRWPVKPADVALGTLAPERQEEAEQLLRTDASFASEVERLQLVRDAMRATPAAAWSPEAPPPLDTDAAFALRPPRPRERWWGRAATGLRDRALPGGGPLVLRPATALAVAAALLVGGLGAGIALDDGPAAPAPRAAEPVVPSRAVELVAFGDDPGPQRGTVSLPEGRGGAVELRVSGAEPSRPGEFYELWLLDDADDLVSVGTYRVGPDGTAEGRFPLGADPSAYKFVDVSVERDDGDPGHSLRSVLRSAELS